MTPPERVEAFLEGIKRTIQANPATRKDLFQAAVNGFDLDHLRILLDVVRLDAALGVKFAFPTQTPAVETFPGKPKPAPPAAGQPGRAARRRRRVRQHRAGSKTRRARYLSAAA